MTVDTDAICAAIKDVFEDTRAILEPAGALAIAGVKAWCEKHRAQDRTLVAIACGANMNFDRLRFVAERAELGEQREAIFAVTIPERPGSFREFCALLGNRSVTEFNYRYADPKVAHLFVGVEVGRPQRDAHDCSRCCTSTGIEAYDLSDNEMAKLHVRHLVGGHAPAAEHEILYRFEFPERPGRADALPRQHERAAGTSACSTTATTAPTTGACWWECRFRRQDSGRIPTFSRPAGVHYVDETANPAYRMFLGR